MLDEPLSRSIFITFCFSAVPFLHICLRFISRSQWPRCLRCESATARFLGFWVRIPQGHKCHSLVSVVHCQAEVSASGRSLVQRSLYRVWCVWM